MKTILSALVLLFLLHGALFSQTYNNPESIVFDKTGNRYFISNKGGNTIVQLDSAGILTNFVVNGLNAPKGLLIVGDTLISVNNTAVKGYKLSDTSLVLNVSITGSSFMNDVTYDGKGNLYISDSSTDKIFKLNLADNTYSTLISSNIDPNGLLYDETTNSIIICSTGSNAKIQSYSLTNGTLSTLVTTSLSSLDGLAKDNCGNIYVSSWGQSGVYVFDSIFQYPPVKISNGHNGPADISINIDEQVLAIPNFNSNSISMIDLGLNCLPELTPTPSNNSLDLNDSIQIDWDDVSEVSGYEIQYSSDSTFYTSTITIQTINSDTILTDLEPSTKYFWRVRTIGGDYKNIFNDIWNFTVQDKATGILKQPLINEYKIYPNPAKEQFIIETSLKVEAINIFSLSGILVKSFISQDSYSISSLNSGVYIMNIHCKTDSFTQKLIIE